MMKAIACLLRLGAVRARYTALRTASARVPRIASTQYVGRAALNDRALRNTSRRHILAGVELPDVVDQVRGFVVQLTYTISGLPHGRLTKLRAHGAIWSVPVGTGFVVSSDGWIITAKHVIDASPPSGRRSQRERTLSGSGSPIKVDLALFG
jgi:S1-C subfamily serine protease